MPKLSPWRKPESQNWPELANELPQEKIKDWHRGRVRICGHIQGQSQRVNREAKHKSQGTRRVSPDTFSRTAERPLLEAPVPCPLAPTPNFEAGLQTCSEIGQQLTILRQGQQLRWHWLLPPREHKSRRTGVVPKCRCPGAWEQLLGSPRAWGSLGSVPPASTPRPYSYPWL